MPTPDNQPATGMAIPVLRGFPCPVTTPFFGAEAGPKEGVGCGWANVGGIGPQFFIVVHAEGGFAMSAQLDYSRWRRFAENWASIGQQAMLTGKLDETTADDPLVALGEAYDAMVVAQAAFRGRKMHGQAEKLVAPLALAAKALMIEVKP